MLKSLTQSAFRTVGLEVRRLPRNRTRQATPIPVDADEVRSLEAALHSFSAAHPEAEPWSKPERAREYLSDERLAFFHELLDVCAANDIGFDGVRVADVGSGTGYLLRLISQRFDAEALIGFDTYPQITHLARHLVPDAEFRAQDLHDIDNERFDVIFCTEVLEHLLHPEEAVCHLLRLLSDGGRLVLTVPDGRRDQFPASSLLENGRGYWGHINFWSPESWPLFLDQAAPGVTPATGQIETGENWAVLH